MGLVSEREREREREWVKNKSSPTHNKARYPDMHLPSSYDPWQTIAISTSRPSRQTTGTHHQDKERPAAAKADGTLANDTERQGQQHKTKQKFPQNEKTPRHGSQRLVALDSSTHFFCTPLPARGVYFKYRIFRCIMRTLNIVFLEQKRWCALYNVCVLYVNECKRNHVNGPRFGGVQYTRARIIHRKIRYISAPYNPTQKESQAFSQHFFSHSIVRGNA